ncbi:MAG TPA: hypothetical protein VGJ97_06495 [Anaerolineaceae bacterium]|jgi:cell division protein FtsB
MNRHAPIANPFIQAYRQAPWRAQLQWIVMFLLALVMVAIVAAIYLSVSAQSAETGREIQTMQMESSDVESQIADLTSQLAALTSAAQMQKRAKDMGFVPVDPSKETFLVIPGYGGRQTAMLAPPPGLSTVPTTLIRPAYTQSLWEWIFHGFLINPLLPSQPKP